jgi:hypothetical protein
MRARCRRSGPSTPAWEIRRPQAVQGRVCQRRGPAMPIRRSNHLLRRARTARSSAGPWGLALRRDSALEHLGCRHNEARTIRRPRPRGRLPGPGRGPRRPPEQAGPARVPVSESGSSCRRCAPVPGARRALLDRGLTGGSRVWFLVPSKRSTRPPLTSPSARAGQRCRGGNRRRTTCRAASARPPGPARPARCRAGAMSTAPGWP